MVGDVLRALPSFPGEAARHGLTPTVPLLFAGNAEVRQKDDRLVSGETTRYLEPAMIMIIFKGQTQAKREQVLTQDECLRLINSSVQLLWWLVLHMIILEK